VRLRICLALAVLTATAALTGSRALAVETASLTLPDAGSALEVKGGSGDDTAEADLTVFNDSDAPVAPLVRLEAASPRGITLNPVDAGAISPGEARAIPLEFTGLANADQKVTGELLVSGGATPLLRQVTITPGPQPFVRWPLLIPLLAALSGALMLGLVLVNRRLRGKLDRPAPGLSLDLGKSFATNLTAIGAVAATVLTGITYPDVPDQMSKNSVTQMVVLFAALVVLAPFIHLGLRSRAPGDPQGKPGAYAELTAGNTGLVITCCMTMVAVLGQLLTLALLTWELLDDDALAVAIVVAVVAVTFCGLAWNYTFWAIRDFLAHDWCTEAKKAWDAAHDPKVPTVAPSRPRARLL
jgi:hypothetical protein